MKFSSGYGVAELRRMLMDGKPVLGKLDIGSGEVRRIDRIHRVSDPVHYAARPLGQMAEYRLLDAWPETAGTQ